MASQITDRLAVRSTTYSCSQLIKLKALHYQITDWFTRGFTGHRHPSGTKGQWYGKYIPGNKVHGANMGPIWGRQDQDGPHVGPMNFAIWDASWCLISYTHFRCVQFMSVALGLQLSMKCGRNLPTVTLMTSVMSIAMASPYTNMITSFNTDRADCTGWSDLRREWTTFIKSSKTTICTKKQCWKLGRFAMPQAYENWLGLENSCDYYACQIRLFTRYCLSVDFKAHRELWYIHWVTRYLVNVVLFGIKDLYRSEMTTKLEKSL